MNIKIDEVLNRCTFIGCYMKKELALEKQILPSLLIANPDDINTWLEETESLCPGSDNISLQLK